MNVFSIISLIGGLAVFLFGMTIMGEGLERSSGTRLKSILESLTKSNFRAVLLGALVTAVIQSSSATTVMVVGFVNSGIIQLSQSIGVIMGANIGTTVTSWILSLSGLTSDNFFVQIFKPANLSYIVAAIGIVLLMTGGSGKKKDFGYVFLGFAILMIGMNTMSEAVRPLKDVPEFTSILLLFKNPILGVMTGAILTAIIQSSSASVGILQALSTTGAMSYNVCIPIIMGQNIGTCVTAILSAIGANKNAKRAAAVHLCFNIIGTIAFMALYFLIKSLVDLPFLDKTVGAAGIAIVHTTFNIFSTVIMFPFIKQLERLAYVIIKDQKTVEKTQMLDERLLNTPSVAIEQCKRFTNEMSTMSRDAFLDSLNLIEKFDKPTSDKIAEIEQNVDLYEDKLGTYLVKISRKQLTVEDSHEVSKLLHCIGDFERISDHAVNLLGVAEEINNKKISFSEDGTAEIMKLKAALNEIVTNTANAFLNDDLEIAKKIEPLEQVIDKMIFELKANHVNRLKSGSCSIETGFVFSDLITNCERVADHCSNVAVCLIEIANDSFDTHEYLRNVKSHGEREFDIEYNKYLKKYNV